MRAVHNSQLDRLNPKEGKIRDGILRSHASRAWLAGFRLNEFRHIGLIAISVDEIRIIRYICVYIKLESGDPATRKIGGVHQ